MNTKPLFVYCTVNDEERQLQLNPSYPGSTIYFIYIDKEPQGQVQKVGQGWIVGLIENSLLTSQHHGAIINAVSSAEHLNN